MEKHPWFLDLDESVLPRWEGKALDGCKAEGGGCIRGQGRVGPMRLWRAVHNQNAGEVRRLVEQGDSPNEVEAAGNTPLHAAAYQGWVEGIELLLQLGAKGPQRACSEKEYFGVNRGAFDWQELSHCLEGGNKTTRIQSRCVPFVQINASNNAGDTPYHTALYMGNEEAMLALEKVRKACAGVPRGCLTGSENVWVQIRAKSTALRAGASKAAGKVLVQEHVPKVKVSIHASREGICLPLHVPKDIVISHKGPCKKGKQFLKGTRKKERLGFLEKFRAP
eukprot:207572-Pelagomonas_calceolata.AAC.3